ncbi:MAG: alpha-L-rhamnosidase N-terminal domain-containing protein [Kiritimatiellae bacterium]|jgi:alpha-L-rhamnosidase|nr:alpha-L-rhamnosidase N-terminal domain-containing protein [Kiritimatiellia bacterium]
MKVSKLLLVVLVLTAVCSISAQTTRKWKAQWITPQDATTSNSWHCFRKSFGLKSKPKSAIAHISCDSKYWLWVNGEMVVFEGQLKRGPTPKNTYYDEVDLAPYLQNRKNNISILVWYWGKHGFSHNNSGQCGLVFELNAGKQTIISDGSWKTKHNSAYLHETAEPHPNYRLPEANVAFDARKQLTRWNEMLYNDVSWPQAVIAGKPPCAPWNNLEKRPVLQWKNSGLIDYVSKERKTNDDGSKTVICKLPYNCHVTPYLKVKAPAGKTIVMKTDNYNGGGAYNMRAEYTTRDGVQEYESFGWINGHDMRYTIPAGVEVLNLKYRETGYNADFVGSFECDNKDLNTLWQKSKRTLYVTMRDNYMDCPDRERAQWWGDMVNELGESFYVFDAEKGPLLTKKGIYELSRWQRDDKVVYAPVPAGLPSSPNVKGDGSWYKELPRQMLASVGWYGFWTYYWYTGDKQTIVDAYPHVRDYMSLWKLDDKGLVIHRKGDWDWTDWGKNKDVPVIENAWVYLTLKACIEMAKLTGSNADVAGYQAKMNKIKAAYNKTFWQGDKYRSSSHKGVTDDRAQAMAVVAGLAETSYYPAIRKQLLSQYEASPYMEKYVLESLYLMDAPEEAVARMLKRWAGQIPSELTTLWEGWGLGKDGYGGGTYNHAWSGGPLTVLSQYGAGVAPTEPAFKEFAVLPQMGQIKTIKSVVPTKFGEIKVNLAQSDAKFSMGLTVPKGTKAVAGIPNKGVKSITINGKEVYADGKSASPMFAGECERWIKFNVGPGEWNVMAK